MAELVNWNMSLKINKTTVKLLHANKNILMKLQKHNNSRKKAICLQQRRMNAAGGSKLSLQHQLNTTITTLLPEYMGRTDVGMLNKK